MIREDERTEDARYWQSARNDLLKSFGVGEKYAENDGEKQETWLEDLLGVDCIMDGSHHVPNWTATRYTPVLRFQLSWGGPGDQWELALSKTRHGWTLRRVCYVFLPWWGYRAHHIRAGSRTWQALERLLEAVYLDDVSPILEVYDEEA